MNIFACGFCGSTRIQVKDWIDIHTEQVLASDASEYWCEDCQMSFEANELLIFP